MTMDKKNELARSPDSDHGISDSENERERLLTGVRSIFYPETTTVIGDIAASERQRFRDILHVINSGKGSIKCSIDFSTTEVSLLGNSSWAKHLADAHNEHLISHAVIDAAKAHARGDKAGTVTLEDMQESAASAGFFMFPYTPEKMLHRLKAKHPPQEAGHTFEGVECAAIPEHREFMIVGIKAPDPDPTRDSYGQTLHGADCQVRLAAPTDNADSIVMMPQEGDDIKKRDWLQSIQERPWRVALVEDIQSSRQLARNNAAATALDKSITALCHENETKRDARYIRYLAAEIATIRGVVLPDGTEIHFDDDIAISNDRSEALFAKFKHSAGHSRRFQLAWELKGRRHNVLMPNDSEPHQLIVDWRVMMSKIKKPEKFEDD